MNAGDWALLIGGCTAVPLAFIGAGVYLIRCDYRIALSATVQKRNPPLPKPKPDGQANVTDITGRAAS